MTAEQKIKGRKIGIIGMARTGMAAARLAKRMGGEPFVSDSAPEEKLMKAVTGLKQEKIEFEVNGHTSKLLTCDYIIVSPGVRSDLAILGQAEEKGVPMFSEIEFASWVCKGKICAITGSNGKTTTTTLLGEMLKQAKVESVVCGNIGNPFAESADSLSESGVAVVEVSSFQLERIEQFRPNVALILNITPDHLDRYESLQEYTTTKYRISENQQVDDALILNYDDSGTNSDDIKTRARIIRFASTDMQEFRAYVSKDQIILQTDSTTINVLAVSEVLIPGPHNLQNSLAAVAAASCLDVTPQVMTNVLKTFRGVEHRLEDVGRVAGITFINDSKATNVDSVCWALQSFKQPLYLIAGGRSKGGEFEALAEFGRRKIKGIVAIGEAREMIFDALGHHFPVQFADDLEQAVQTTFDLAIPGDMVLLSPGCASFDMFEDYEHRGRVFKGAVSALKNGKEKDETVVG